MSDQCPICHQWKFSNHHTCPPLWEVREVTADSNEDWHNIRAWEASGAAEKYADDYDCHGDYTIIRGTSIKVDVRAFASDKIERFEVTGESVPSYTAERILEETKDGV